MKIDSLYSMAKNYDGHKYHRAAFDGYVDMLCDTSKKDANLASVDGGFTPTHLAACNGQLEALRTLVGRGGDPEKPVDDGSNALHLSAARNHLNCVSFLVNFGVNMWALDNELRTAKDVAALEQKREVLNYLDQMMAKQSALNTKNVQKLKEKAKIATERRLKQLRKAQLKSIKQVEKNERFLVKLSTNRRLLKAAHSISDIKLVGKSSTSEFNCSSYSSSNRLVGAQSIDSLSNLRCNGDLMSGGLTSASSTIGLNFSNLDQRKSKSCLNNSDLESAYASSVSSTSDYNSSGGSQSGPSLASQNRPKFSDLVALNHESPVNTSPSLPRDIRDSNNNESIQQTVKSNSTISAKLRALGGVSRKMQFKRMLQSNSSNNSQPIQAISMNKKVSETLELPDTSQESTGISGTPFDSSSKRRLCKVLPAIKLTTTVDQQTNPKVTAANQTTNYNTVSSIKWPPAPTLTRTTNQEAKSNGDSKSGCSNQNPDDEQDFEQHQLLTKCLTQLKLQHEAIYSRQTSNCSSSDELIQHQLSAGEFPLRPSLIKQQQLTSHQFKNKSCNPKAGASPSVRSTTVMSVDSIGSAGSFVRRNSRGFSSFKSNSRSSCSSLAVAEESDVQQEEKRSKAQLQDSLETFLALNGLSDLSEVFAKEQIDLEALKLLSEDDLKSLNILLGPRRKLMKAIERRAELEQRRLVESSRGNFRLDDNSNAVYTMVDTQL